jgi:hypothetical protein
VISEVYIERNMEVHKNIKSEFGEMKLKDDFIWMTLNTVGVIIRSLNERNKKDICKIMDKIESLSNRIT